MGQLMSARSFCHMLACMQSSVSGIEHRDFSSLPHVECQFPWSSGSYVSLLLGGVQPPYVMHQSQ